MKGELQHLKDHITSAYGMQLSIQDRRSIRVHWDPSRVGAGFSERDDGVEDDVPHLARHSEAQVEVLVVVGEVVLLHLLHVRGETRMVEPRKDEVRSVLYRPSLLLMLRTRSACNHTTHLRQRFRAFSLACTRRLTEYKCTSDNTVADRAREYEVRESREGE